MPSLLLFLPLPSKLSPRITWCRCVPEEGFARMDTGIRYLVCSGSSSLISKLSAVSGSIFSALCRLHPYNIPVTRNCSHFRNGGPKVRMAHKRTQLEISRTETRTMALCLQKLLSRPLNHTIILLGCSLFTCNAL